MRHDPRLPRHRPAPAPQDAEAAAELRARIRALRDESEQKRARDTAERRHLLDLLGPEDLARYRIVDVDAAVTCPCSCHPSVADIAMHGEGVCSCQKTPEQRRADQEEALSLLQQHSGELARAVESELVALRAVAAELGVEIEQAGGMAPYQIVGQVDGIRFYLRERYDEWSVQVPDEEAGDLGDPVGVQSGTYVIAEGLAGELYSAEDPAGPLRTAVAAVREHLARRSCAHPGARTFCPDCGARTAGA
jgi:hypothetical protein